VVVLFDSLREWLTCPFQVKHFDGYTPSADRKYTEPEDMIGYFVGNVEVVTDVNGDDVVSSTQLYYDPADYTIGSLDKVLVDGEEKDIVQITNYMDGNYGESSIKVVYL